MWPDAPASPMPAAAQPPPCHNLPEPRTRFVGRQAALADLARLLPMTRLLTLTGIGGCGKTRLALQFAQRQAPSFADGVWFVDLAPLKDADRVAATCAAVLGIREDQDTPLVDKLLEHLAGRSTLLVLDNCEHVFDGAVALADALLAGSGGTTILATSREGLGVSGGQIYTGRSLSLPATLELQAVQEAESVRVFVDRARLAQPDFEVDVGNAAAVVEICRRLDGIALAIELAAARVTMLSPAQIAARLDDRFRLLTGGNRALPRHQTLQAAMQWSYEQQAPPERRLLRLVSVFAGGWTLCATADVAGIANEYEALALLTALHDKSLIDVDREVSGGRPRYRMLETVRQFALDRLNECGEGEAARHRHAAYCVAMAEAAEPHVRGPEQDLWMRRFKQEHENLVVAFGWCCEGPVDPQLGLRLAAATGYYWGWNSVELGYRLLRAVLEHDRSGRDTPARENTLLALARLSVFRGHYEESLAYAQWALATARRRAVPLPLARSLGAVGSALKSLGRIDEGARFDDEALALARKAGEGMLLFSLLNNIASSEHGSGELDAAERGLREALELAQQHAGRVGQVVVLHNLIRVLVARGRLDEARRPALECLPLARHEKVGVDLLEATVGLASSLGDHATAARFWGAADQQLLDWGYQHEPSELEHTGLLLARSRHALGDVAFEAAEAAGRKLPFERAMDELAQWMGHAGSAAAGWRVRPVPVSLGPRWSYNFSLLS
jgi:predicted ATPase